MTRTQVITRFSLHYPDCDSTNAGLLFDQAHQEISNELNIRAATLVISLVAGQRDGYVLGASNKRWTEAYYQISSTETTWRKLNFVSKDQLAERGNWRAMPQQVIPTEIYLDTEEDGNSSITTIGFVQVPPVTTVAGYPNVTIYGEFVDDLTGSEELPEMISYTDVYVYHMCMKFCVLKQDSDRALYWERQFDKEMQKNKASIRGWQFGNEGTFVRPSFINTFTGRR